jgi:hypothetical protein
MNLVAKEFVAARSDLRGVLVLSRFTGAAQELTEAVLINPYATDEFAEALRLALAMPEAEQERRLRQLRAGAGQQHLPVGGDAAVGGKQVVAALSRGGTRTGVSSRQDGDRILTGQRASRHTNGQDLDLCKASPG